MVLIEIKSNNRCTVICFFNKILNLKIFIGDAVNSPKSSYSRSPRSDHGSPMSPRRITSENSRILQSLPDNTRIQHALSDSLSIRQSASDNSRIRHNDMQDLEEEEEEDMNHQENSLSNHGEIFMDSSYFVVCCCKLSNTRVSDEHLFRQVSTPTGRNQLPIFCSTNFHPGRHACLLIYAHCLRWRHESEWAHNNFIA